MTMTKHIILAALAVFTIFAVSMSPSAYFDTTAHAANACQKSCDRAFADCYKSSGGDRRGCAVARARCRSKCLRQ